MQRLLIPSMFSLVLFGCGGGTTTEEAATGTAAGSTTQSSGELQTVASYDTPEAAYAALREATTAKDWRKVGPLLSPESQAMLAGMSIMGCSFATMGDPAKEKDLQKLLAKHGVNLDEDEPEPSAEDQTGGPEEMMMAMTKSIPDMPAFLAEINAWMDKNADEASGGFAELGKLGDVTIDGDTATAQTETDFGPQPIEFRKIGGGWVVHLPMGGPSEGGMSEFEEEVAEDDGTPGLGTFWLGEEAATLRHAMAYRSKFFDDPCTTVLLTARPIPERQLDDLKRMLKEDGNDDAFFPRGTHIKLSLDESGELMFLFAWADNMSISRNDGVDLDVTIEGNRIQGTAGMSEPEEVADTTYRFDAEFDVELMEISE